MNDKKMTKTEMLMFCILLNNPQMSYQDDEFYNLTDIILNQGDKKVEEYIMNTRDVVAKEIFIQ